MRPFWRNVGADIDDELEFHFEQRVAQFVKQGLSRSDAEAAARAQFGEVTPVRRELARIDERMARRSSLAQAADGWAEDVRWSLRSLRRQPRFAWGVVLTLALGLGANAAMFSFLDRVFWRPPAGVADARHVHLLWTESRNLRTGVSSIGQRISGPQFEALQEPIGTDARFAAFRPQLNARLGSGDNAKPITLTHADANFLPVLGVRLAAGRLFTADEEANDAPLVAVAREQFGGAGRAVGGHLTLSGVDFTVIGVTAPGFAGPDLDRTDFWIPFRACLVGGPPCTPRTRGGGSVYVIARVPASVSEERLETRVTQVLQRAASLQYPGDQRRLRTADSLTRVMFGSVVQARGPRTQSDEVRIAVRVAGVTLLVLLTACANVVNLFLARVVTRRREIAVRLALGISRARLVRLLTIESVVLALLASVAAGASASLTGSVLRALLMPDIAFGDPAMHWRVVAFTALVATAVGLAIGLIPTLQALKPQLTDALRGGPRDGATHRSALRSTLVVAQVAFSAVLLVGAIAFVRSLRNVESIRIGYDASRVTFASVYFTTPSTWPDSARLASAAQRVRSLNGVEHVALLGYDPYRSSMGGRVFPEGGAPPADDASTPMTLASPEFFDAVGMRIVRGRGYDDASGRSVVVSELAAQRLWPGADALGRCLHLLTADSPCYLVVGVAENARHAYVTMEDAPRVYVPLAYSPASAFRASMLALRADPARSAAVAADVRRILRDEFPAARPAVRRMIDDVANDYRPWQLGATLFTVFGLLAFVVTLVGIYSTVSYGVAQRAHEFGVRLALGARLTDVMRHVLASGLRPVGLGIACGVIGAIFAGKLIASLLYGVSPAEPLTLGAVAVAVLAAAAAAALVPAWRAGRVDPATALRAE